MTDKQAAQRRLDFVRERMDRATTRTGRSPSEVTLLPVTKTRSIEEIRCLQSLGLTEFGENRVAELNGKIPQFGGECRWHMIGHLQSNKAKECLGVVRLHSLDSATAAQALEKAFFQAGKTLHVLLEVNSGEEQKHGLSSLDDLRRLRDLVRTCPHLVCDGLMTMAPFVQDEVVLRRTFARLYSWRELLAAEDGDNSWPVLSMGMSNDFEYAIQEGSTMVRVGTALFEDGR